MTEQEEATPSPWTSAHMKQVKSLLHDRQQCATVHGLTRDLQISRTAASRLLQAVVEEGEHQPWQATICQSKQEELTSIGEESIPCTGK